MVIYSNSERKIVIYRKNRTRIDYTKNVLPLNLIYFDDRPLSLIRYCHSAPVTYEDVKPGYYTIDTEGQVYNTDGQPVFPRMINSGYMVYALVTGHHNPKYKNITAHRLVKSTFDPIDEEGKYTVDHISADKRQNFLDNLKWATQKENNDRKYLIMSSSGINNYRASFTFEQLQSIVDGLDSGKKYSDILKSIGMEVTENNKDYIGNIKRGITYIEDVKSIRLDRGSTTNGDECSRVEIK